jgi:hypothetical protein
MNLFSPDFFDPNLWYTLEDGYHAKCFYFDCPVNHEGICSTCHIEIPKFLCHDFDGKNNWKCPCG